MATTRKNTDPKDATRRTQTPTNRPRENDNGDDITEKQEKHDNSGMRRSEEEEGIAFWLKFWSRLFFSWCVVVCERSAVRMIPLWNPSHLGFGSSES